MPPELMYVSAMVQALRARTRNLTRADRSDAGLTTLEVAIIAGGLALLAAGVITAISAAVSKHKGSIK